MKPIKIAAEAYRTDESHKGLALYLSTYDVPRQARADFDAKAGVLRIRFDYVDAEPAKIEPLTRDSDVLLGKHSGKILGFDVRVNEHRIHEVTLKVSQVLQDLSNALDSRIAQLSRVNQKMNHALVRKLMADRRNRASFVEAAAP